MYRILSGKREASAGSWLCRRVERRVWTWWLGFGKCRRATDVVVRWPREPHADVVVGRRDSRGRRRVEGDREGILFGSECANL